MFRSQKEANIDSLSNKKIDTAKHGLAEYYYQKESNNYMDEEAAKPKLNRFLDQSECNTLIRYLLETSDYPSIFLDYWSNLDMSKEPHMGIGHNFYSNEVFKSMPEMSNSSEVEIKIKPISSRMFKIFGTQDSESEKETSNDNNNFAKNRFQQIDVKNLTSTDSYSFVNQNGQNLNLFKSSKIELRNEEINTEKSEYSEADMISPLIRPPSMGIIPVGTNRFIKNQADERINNGLKTLARTLSMPIVSHKEGEIFTKMINYIDHKVKAELVPSDSEVEARLEKFNLGRFLFQGKASKDLQNSTSKHDESDFQISNAQSNKNADEFHSNKAKIPTSQNRFSINSIRGENHQKNDDEEDFLEPQTTKI